jgi:hypothetical protein
MGFKFRRSFTIVPGVRINLSRGGVSTSIGRPGATSNIDKRGVRGSVSLPATGVSYTDTIIKRGAQPGSRGDFEERTAGTAVRRSTRWIAVRAVVILAVIALLFAAGLQSAKDGGTSSTFTPANGGAGSGLALDATEEAGQEPAAASERSRARARLVKDASCKSNPAPRAPLVAMMPGSQMVHVMDQQSVWTRVATDDQDCWVRSDDVR